MLTHSALLTDMIQKKNCCSDVIIILDNVSPNIVDILINCLYTGRYLIQQTIKFTQTINCDILR